MDPIRLVQRQVGINFVGLLIQPHITHALAQKRRQWHAIRKALRANIENNSKAGTLSMSDAVQKDTMQLAC